MICTSHASPPGPHKPWRGEGQYLDEWKDLLCRADEIDMTAIPTGSVWSPDRIAEVSSFFERRLALPRVLKRYFDLAALRDYIGGYRGRGPRSGG